MRFLLHGTSKNGFEGIKTNGFQPNKINNWIFSEPDTVYFYDSAKIKDKKEIFQLAFEQAALTAAIVNQLSDELYVFYIEIPDDLELNDDVSCENMYYKAISVNISDSILVSYRVYKSNDYNPSLRLFYLNNVNLNNINTNLSRNEYSFLNIINKSNIYEELLWDFKYELIP